jgi:orotidine-5'-phosphate decarboxylase
MSRLVVALDAPVPEEAERIVDELYDFDVIFKIGLEPLLGYADRIVGYCEARDVRYCVDAKLHDIPRTAGAAARQLVAPAMRMLTVHALGGVEMMRAAVDGVRERAETLGIQAPHVFAVTLLTSIADDGIADLGLSGGLAENVMRLASLARDAGCAGVVCSPREVREVKAVFGDDLLTLVPGVRPAGSASRDQQRAGTPGKAAAAGADYIVVGRPILEAPDRRAAAAAILHEIAPYDR